MGEISGQPQPHFYQQDVTSHHPPQEVHKKEEKLLSQKNFVSNASTVSPSSHQKKVEYQIEQVAEARFASECSDEEITAAANMFLMATAAPKESKNLCDVISVDRNGVLVSHADKAMFISNAKNMSTEERLQYIFTQDQGPGKPSKATISQTLAQSQPDVVRRLREEKYDVHIITDESFLELFKACVAAMEMGLVVKAEQEKKEKESAREPSTTDVKDRPKGPTSEEIIAQRFPKGLSKEREKEKFLLEHPLIRIALDFFKDWLDHQAKIKKEKIEVDKAQRIETKELELETRKREQRKLEELKVAIRQELGLPPEPKTPEQVDKEKQQLQPG